jgi:hypothetical protein
MCVAFEVIVVLPRPRAAARRIAFLEDAEPVLADDRQHHAAVGGPSLGADEHVQAAQPRHGDVGKDQVGRIAVEQSDRLLRLGGDRAIVPLPAEFVLNQGAYRRLVVHDQHFVGTGCHDAAPFCGPDPISDIGTNRAALKLQQPHNCQR